MGLITTKVSGSTGHIAVTGSFQATDFIYAMGFGNSSSIGNSHTTPHNYNSVLFGPITILKGIEFKINTSSAVKIKDISSF